MDMIGKVRRMRLRDQLSVGEICRRTGLARNTVKKWLKAPADLSPNYQRKKAEGKLTPFESSLQQALRADAHRPKQARRSGKALFAQIQAQGYRGGYSAVTDFIRAWREESAKDPYQNWIGTPGQDSIGANILHILDCCSNPLETQFHSALPRLIVIILFLWSSLPMPQLLCCAFRGPGGDDNLYYIPGWPGSDAKTMTWGPRKIQLPNRRAVSGPALAVHNNVLFMVYPDYEARLRYTTWNDSTKQWNPDAYVGGAMSNMTPSLVVYGERLYCLHTGNQDEQLFWCVYENGTWNPDNYLAANKSGSGPSGIVYKGTLFCVHRSNADYQRRRPIYAATFHSDYNWGDSYEVDNGRYSASPASASKVGVAVLGKTANSDGVLYCVFRGQNLTIEDRKIWTTTLDTQTVNGEIQLTMSNPNISNQVYKTTDGPAVAAIHGSDGSEGLWMTARVVEDDAYLFSARWDLRSPWNTSPWVDASHLGQAQLYYDPALVAVDSTIFSPV